MESKIRIAIIGTAKRSDHFYGPILRGLPGVELVAVWGRSTNSVRKLGESLQVPWYTDLTRLVKETAPQIGIVSVAYNANGEAGLMAYAGDTFRDGVVSATVEVDVVAPSRLPHTDIVKLDIEGGEAEVLAALDLSGTALVLAEFQNRRNRIAMQATLAQAGFDALRDEECPWDPILDYKDYRQDLKGDIYGHMFYVRKGQTRLAGRGMA